MNDTNLGNFSVSLAVKNLQASRSFYEKLGFAAGMGDGKNWLIMQNATATIGLFQGMFQNNLLTFNPGWDRNAQPLKEFTDVRELRKRFEAAGVALTNAADSSFMVTDPDGNTILVDQHV